VPKLLTYENPVMKQDVYFCLLFTESLAAKLIETKSDNRQIPYNTDANTHRLVFAVKFNLIKLEYVVYLCYCDIIFWNF